MKTIQQLEDEIKANKEQIEQIKTNQEQERIDKLIARVAEKAYTCQEDGEITCYLWFSIDGTTYLKIRDCNAKSGDWSFYGEETAYAPERLEKLLLTAEPMDQYNRDKILKAMNKSANKYLFQITQD